MSPAPSESPLLCASKVAHGHLAGGVRVVHAEAGKLVGDLVVPRELALVDEDGQRGSDECLGARADGEDRVLVGGRRLAQLAQAVALRQHRLVALDDGEREARCVEGLQRLRHVIVDVRRRRGEERRGNQGGSRRERESFHCPLLSAGQP
jgi:hypothetical protein